MIPAQGHVAGPTGPLDMLGGNRQPERQSVQSMEDPTAWHSCLIHATYDTRRQASYMSCQAAGTINHTAFEGLEGS